MTTEVHSACLFDAQYGDVKVFLEEKEDSLVVEIETLRLKILSVNTDQYKRSLVDLYGDRTVNQCVGTGATLSAELVSAKIRRWNTRWSEKNPFSGYVVVKKDTEEFVGQIILKPVKDRSAPGTFITGTAEIGFLSCEKHWGNKYGQEFTHAMVHHFLPKLIDLGYEVKGHPITSIMATARIDNIASNCVLKKLLNHTGTKERYGAPREWYEHKFI
ncbi:MAG: GNAT family N-acetyltransferase [Verrucomicrobia bacterium]|nr:GNAT family N-acetyltransferase [Verrucomicrobiota bacterium]